MSLPSSSSLLPGSPVTVTISTALARARIGSASAMARAALRLPSQQTIIRSSLSARLLDVRHDQDRPAGFEQRRLRDLPLRPDGIRLGLGDNRDIEPPGDARRTGRRYRHSPSSSQPRFGGEPVTARRLLESGDGCLRGLFGCDTLRLDDACGRPVEQRPRHDRPVDESDGGEVRVEGAGYRRREIGRDVVFGIHRQVDDDILDHDAPRCCSEQMDSSA